MPSPIFDFADIRSADAAMHGYKIPPHEVEEIEAMQRFLKYRTTTPSLKPKST